MSEQKNPAVLAAASPDPAVRGLAVRLQEIRTEEKQIHTFLDLYGQLVEKVQTEREAPPPPPPPPVEEAGVPRDEFVLLVRDVMLQAGRPLKPGELFSRLHAKNPDAVRSGADALRKRLYKLKEHFQRVGTDRHWPIDVPLPSGAAAG